MNDLFFFLVLTWYSHFLSELFYFSLRLYFATEHILHTVTESKNAKEELSDVDMVINQQCDPCFESMRLTGTPSSESGPIHESHQPDGVLQDKVSGLYHIITPSAAFIVSFFTC